jgi:hypothetical protein
LNKNQLSNVLEMDSKAFLKSIKSIPQFQQSFGETWEELSELQGRYFGPSH